MLSFQILGLVIVYAGYSVAALTASLNSELNPENQFNSYSSRLSNAARKPAASSFYSGSSEIFGQSNSYGGYDFEYTVADGRGNTHYHKAEKDDTGAVRGTYGYKDIRGLYRIVDYIADASGFHAKIKTNEPGTNGKSPAYAEMIAEPSPTIFQENYAEVSWIQKAERIYDHSQYEQDTETINTGDEPPLDVPRSMVAAVHKSYLSSYSGGISEEDDDEDEK